MLTFPHYFMSSVQKNSFKKLVTHLRHEIVRKSERSLFRTILYLVFKKLIMHLGDEIVRKSEHSLFRTISCLVFKKLIMHLRHGLVWKSECSLLCVISCLRCVVWDFLNTGHEIVHTSGCSLFCMIQCLISVVSVFSTVRPEIVCKSEHSLFGTISCLRLKPTCWTYMNHRLCQNNWRHHRSPRMARTSGLLVMTFLAECRLHLWFSQALPLHIYNDTVPTMAYCNCNWQ